MDNASKALIIAGAILISILIIAIAMYIYNSSTSSITAGINSMNTQEINAFNSQWTNYEGALTGSQVKALITVIISNADTYQDEEAKVVKLGIDATGNNKLTNVDYKPDATNGLKDFIGNLNKQYDAVKAKHTYHVSFDYEGTKIIRRINIAY